MAEPGYLLSKAGVPKHAIITAVASTATPDLPAFVEALKVRTEGSASGVWSWTVAQRGIRQQHRRLRSTGHHGAPKARRQGFLLVPVNRRSALPGQLWESTRIPFGLPSPIVVAAPGPRAARAAAVLHLWREAPQEEHAAARGLELVGGGVCGR